MSIGENQAPENKCHACYKHKCAHNSTCVAVATKSDGDEDEYKCECPIGYYGARCDRQIDACFGQPCKNSGTCRVLSGGAGGRYVCECAPGWEGFACEINTNECRSAPCKNGATCVDKLAGFECNCAFGFTGIINFFQTLWSYLIILISFPKWIILYILPIVSLYSWFNC